MTHAPAIGPIAVVLLACASACAGEHGPASPPGVGAADRQPAAPSSSSRPTDPAPAPAPAPEVAPRLSHLVIDRRQPAYAVLVGVDAATSPADLDVLRARLGGDDALVPWARVLADPAATLGVAIVDDRYGTRGRLPEVLRVLERYPGTPIGLTWDGGLALTATDYRVAERRFAERDASAAVLDPASDPLAPAHHLEALLAD